jgi:DNA adenine methylase
MSHSKLIIEEDLVKDINTKSIDIPKPIIKWVGGKTQIIDKILGEFPININNYREIFLGGGSILLAVLTYIKHGVIKISGQIYAYDLNETLISMYKNIQLNHIELFNEIQKLISDYNECGQGEINRKPKTIAEAKETQENYYYWSREIYNKMSVEQKNQPIGSAYFIFLNKTCFRGVFRTGPNGFNVPFGHYKNPEIINLEHLTSISKLIKDVVFKCSDFSDSLLKIDDDDFVYLDPPYAPETNTSFVNYTDKGFTLENHNSLFKRLNEINKENKKFILSNADVQLVRDNFKEKNYKIESITCKRSINSKKPDSKTQEVIIKNY